MDLCLISLRGRLGIFCFLLLLENHSIESMYLILETGSRNRVVSALSI